MDLPARVGRYEIELLLGEGGIGRVFLARDPVLGRQVAIKVLRDDLGFSTEQQRELTERVRQDARGLATLSHPVLIALHDMGDDRNVGLYLVFELARGPTLRERLHEAPLTTAEVASLARALGSALTHVHAAGLVHRGVKPENVMLAPTGPKLTDLGISHADLRAPGYSAPEVLASGSFTALGDEFSLAATMYEALTGRRAFPGDDPEAIAAKVASGRHASPRSALPALRGYLRLDTVFVRALAREPHRRFPSCEAFGSTLSAELEGPHMTFLATPGPLRSSASRVTRKWQNWVALLAVAVIFTLMAVGRIQRSSRDLQPATDKSGGDDKPGASMHRVVPPQTYKPVHSSSFAGPSASATSSAAASASPISSAGRIVDP